MKDTNYYNKESNQYSKKRYPKLLTEYTHFLFKKRLSILINLIDSILVGKKGVKLLEIGCADGVVLKEINKKFNVFTTLVGVDISPKMIDTAKDNNESKKIYYHMRNNEKLNEEQFDIIIEIGVLNFVNFISELNFVKNLLKKDGYYICSLAGESSLTTILKPENKKDYKHFESYKNYENELKERFSLINSVPYGLFIPHIWKIPFLAREVQPFVEFLIKKIFPNLFHEKMYLLKKK